MIASLKPVHLVVSQKRQAADTLTQAFRDDPMYTYVFPTVEERLKHTAHMCEALISTSLRFGEVYTTTEIEGVACWLRPGTTDINLWRAFRTGFALQRAIIAFPKEARDRMLGIVELTDKLRQQAMQHQPYWYLWIIGVLPGSQGRGIGSRLLQPVLDRADAESIPCYLETETESNVTFYEKRGFAVMTVEEISDHSLKLWTMIREPK